MLKILGATGVLIFIATLFLVELPETSIFINPDTESNKILFDAKNSIPEPVFPEKPVGKTVIETKTIEHKIRIPNPSIVNPGGMKTKTIRTQVPVEKFVSPATSDIRAWESEISKIRMAYDVKLNREIKRLESIKEDQFHNSIQSWGKILGGLLAGIGGLVTIILSIRKDRREQEKHDLEMTIKTDVKQD